VTHGEVDLGVLLRELQPERRDGEYVFVSVADVPVGASLVALVREDEGTTLVLTLEEARRLDLASDDVDPMAMITLRVHSALTAVGLTAAVASTLAARSISCNVVAGFHHDHLFVPADRAADAIAALHELSASAPRPPGLGQTGRIG
jgi:uncharacterized protein